MEKRGFDQLFKRELGFSVPKTKQTLSEVYVVNKVNLYKRLEAEGDDGPIRFSCMEFNNDGDFLYSADHTSTSDTVQTWNWEANQLMSECDSGMDGVNDLKVLPLCNDKLIMCGFNGQVRLAEGEDNALMYTKIIGLHPRSASKAAEVSGDQFIFYTCGMDGCVLHHDLRSANDLGRRLFRCSRIVPETHMPLCLYAPNHNRLKSIAVNPTKTHNFCVGGEDKIVRVYDDRMLGDNITNDWDCCVDTFWPTAMVVDSKPFGLISTLAYSKTGELLVSYMGQQTYLFDKDMGFGPSPLMIEPEFMEETAAPWSFAGEHACFFGEFDDFVLSSCESDISIWRKKGTKLLRQIQGDKLGVNYMKSHPQGIVFATCGSDAVVNVWAPTSDQTNLPLPAWHLKPIEEW